MPMNGLPFQLLVRYTIYNLSLWDVKLIPLVSKFLVKKLVLCQKGIICVYDLSLEIH
jgi:hypothetical protein